MVAPMMRLRLFWAAAAVAAPSAAATSSPQCSAVFPPELRIACGGAAPGSKHGKGLKDTPELCAARGCCWAPSTTEAQTTAAPAPAPGCLSGSLNTPSSGVKTETWTQHVAFSNPAGFRVQVEIAGYVHNGHRGGPGACCGNVFNVSAVNVNNIGFDVKVERWCGPAGCKGIYVGWGQQLLLAWKAGQRSTSCKFPPMPSPNPSPTPPPSPLPPAQCYYSSPALPADEVKEVIIIDADHLDEGYHGQVTDVNNRYFDVFWPRAMNIAKELKAGAKRICTVVFCSLTE